MLKRAVVILALLCVIAILSFSQTPEGKGIVIQSGAHNTTVEKDAENKQQHPASPLPSGVAVNNQTSGTDTQGKEGQHKEEIEIQRQLAEYTCWLVVVGFIQFVALCVQAYMLIHHSGHLKNLVQALMDAERAWIVEKVSFYDHIPSRAEIDDGTILIDYEFRNIGKQPAIIQGIQMRFHPTSNPLPAKPVYNELAFMPDPEINGRLLAPNERIEFSCPLEGMNLDGIEIKQISNGSLGLYAYGVIEYDSGGLKGRTTQFCYQWHDPKVGRSFEEKVARFRKRGPSAYNRAT